MVSTFATKIRNLGLTYTFTRHLSQSVKNSPNLKIAQTPNLQNENVKRFFNSKCWKCGIERKRRLLFCDKCNIIQNPEVRDNFFKVFEIEERFNVDQKLLTKRFRELQNLLHPDKFSTKTDEEKTISEEYSSLLNKAYKNLQVPILRALHLLEIKGESLEEEEKVDDPSFLMEIMEINEEIDDADTNEKILKINSKNKATIETLIKEIGDCFEENNVKAAKENIIKLKYFNSINDRINNLTRELGI